MKGLLIASAALAVLIGTPALAADMPLKAPSPPPAPIANWSGCYLGLNAGAMISNDHYDLSMAGGFLDPANIFSNPANNSQLNHSYTPNPGGITGGGQIGCNQQTGTWVWGVEADMDGASRLSTTNNYGPAGPFTGAPPGLLAASHTEQVTKGADWYSTVRARLGYTVTPTWLIYATGGLAVGEIKSSTNVQFGADQFFLGSLGFTGSQTVTRTGWTVGAGTEWALGSNWSVKAEYLFLDFGSLTYLSACSGALCLGGLPVSWQTHVRTEESVFRLGVNYKFGGPLMAKY